MWQSTSPSKTKLGDHWTQFMQDCQNALNDGETDLKGPTRQDMINWMDDAMKSVKTTDAIAKSFKVTGISTALSGSEDHMLHDFDDEEFSGFDATDINESEDPFGDID